MTKDQSAKITALLQLPSSASGSGPTMTNANGAPMADVAVQSVQACVLVLKYKGASEGEHLTRFLV